MQIRLDIKGLREMQKALERYPERAQKALTAALTVEAERIMAEAKRLTPVDTGALRASGHVAKPIQKEDFVEVQLGFGGPAVDYALYVHENLEANFRVGQAKYLETPFMAAHAGLANRLAAYVKRNLR